MLLQLGGCWLHGERCFKCAAQTALSILSWEAAEVAVLPCRTSCRASMGPGLSSPRAMTLPPPDALLCSNRKFYLKVTRALSFLWAQAFPSTSRLPASDEVPLPSQHLQLASGVAHAAARGGWGEGWPPSAAAQEPCCTMSTRRTLQHAVMLAGGLSRGGALPPAGRQLQQACSCRLLTGG